MSHFNLKTRIQPVYEPNQVLSSNHLNLEQDYLVQSDLMTNAHAIGTGILTGLNADIIERGNKLKKIDLSCGAGITSYGFLAVVDKCSLEYARPYKDPYVETDNDKIIKGYPLFWEGTGSRRQQLNILELLTADEVSNLSTAEAASFKIERKNIKTKDYVLLIYVESKDEDIKSCILGDCNDRGRKIITNVRKLLIKKSDIDLSSVNNPYLEAGLEPLRMKRVLDFIDPINLKSAYGDICLDIIPRLADAVEKSYKYFAPYLQNDTELKNIKNNLLEQLRNVNDTHIQLFYDYMRDLVTAYNEFISIGTCIMSAGCVKENAFPRHLFATELQSKTIYPEYRHYFHGPAGTSGEEKSLKSLSRQYLKISTMIKSFNTGNLSDKGVRILPQLDIESSKNTIPYYYDLKSNDALKNIWDIDATLHGISGKTAFHYNDINMNNDSNRLLLNIDDQEMFRIEGHLGQPSDLVVQQIEEYKSENRLAFDLVKLTSTEEVSPDQKNLMNYATMEYNYADCRSQIIMEMRQISAFLHKTIDDSDNWLFYTGQSMPDAEPLIGLIGELAEFAGSNLSAFDVARFYDRYLGVLNEAAIYQAHLSYLVQQVTAVSLESPFDKSIAGKSSAPYYMLLGLAIDEVRCRISALFSGLNINPIIAIGYRFENEVRWLEENNPELFSVFIKRHEGIEHISGVNKGGTFILLVDDGVVIGDFYLPYLCCFNGIASNQFIETKEVYPFYLECEHDREISLIDLNIFDEKLIENNGLFLSDGQQIHLEKPVTFDKYNNSLIIRRGENGFELVLLTGKRVAKEPIKFVMKPRGRENEEYHFWVALRPPIIIANDDNAVTVINKEISIDLLDNDLYLSNDIKISINNEPEKGELKQNSKNNNIVIYKPHTDKQGADYFDYSITMYTEYGVEVTSYARVTIHIVECIKSDFVPVPEKSGVTLPVNTFCTDDNKRYYFKVTGKAKVLDQNGVVFFGKKGTQKSGRTKKGSVVRGFTSLPLETMTPRTMRESRRPEIRRGRVRASTFTISPRILSGIDFSRFDTSSIAVKKNMHPAFIPSSKNLNSGKNAIKYQITNANGSVQNKSLNVNLVEMPEKFTAFVDWKNSNRGRVEVKFSYSMKPENTKAKFKWNFGDGKTSNEASPSHRYKVKDGRKVEVYLNVILDGNNICRRDIRQEVRLYQAELKGILEKLRETGLFYDGIRNNGSIKTVVTEKEISDLEGLKHFLPTMEILLEGKKGEENLRAGKLDKVFADNMNESMRKTKKVASDISDRRGSNAAEPVGELIGDHVDIIAKYVVGKNEPLNNETRKVMESAERSIKEMKRKNIDVNKNDALARKLERTIAVTKHDDVKARLKSLVRTIRQP